MLSLYIVTYYWTIEYPILYCLGYSDINVRYRQIKGGGRSAKCLLQRLVTPWPQKASKWCQVIIDDQKAIRTTNFHCHDLLYGYASKRPWSLFCERVLTDNLCQPNKNIHKPLKCPKEHQIRQSFSTIPPCTDPQSVSLVVYYLKINETCKIVYTWWTCHWDNFMIQTTREYQQIICLILETTCYGQIGQ